MKLQPIIKVRLAKYREDYQLSTAKDGIVFERFSNQTILSTHQPEAFRVSDYLLDAVCVGGHNDMGLDGICVKLNGLLISSLQDAKDIFEKYNKADIEFIFIQSKYKEKFDSGEYAKFVNGVVDFLGEDHFQPSNEQIKDWLDIRDYLLSNEVMMRWSHNPNVRLYYVVMGSWENSTHITAISEKCKKDINRMEAFGEISIQYVDTVLFKRILDENENSYSAIINVIDTFSLTAVDNVENSSIILCSGEELLKLLVSQEGLIRKNLFDDNVRDFQGDTSINSDIYHTIETLPQSFVLLNNGITIVCNEIGMGNRKITIRNPQIVNGCQTCNVIYQAYRQGLDLSSVTIIAKIIATNSLDITNSIVKGTNRQNIVYDEAFEITRQFHKDLEELFSALVSENGVRLFYERRSKQFADNPTIKPFEKTNFRCVIQSFVSVFLNEPFQGHRHESKLLQEYQNKIFIDSQSKFPYYVAALILVNIENAFRTQTIPKELYAYKMHICWMFKEHVGKNCPNINNEKEIDNYCGILTQHLLDGVSASKSIADICCLFAEAQKNWVTEKGASYRYGIKDSQEFFSYLRKIVYVANGSIDIAQEPLEYRGTIIKTGVDRHGKNYGFISKVPDNIFFHESENPAINFADLYGKDVLYTTTKSPVTGNEQAVKVRLV